MTKSQVEAKIKAIEYILENKLYDEEVEDEILSDLADLYDQLEDPKEAQEDTKKSSEVESILKQRKSQYGDYNTFVTDMRNILNILTTRKEGGDIYDEEDVENFFFVLKLLRMQTADGLDSITDLIGYATLAKERRDARNNS
jgi:UDP-N-acetylglucosamine enolpyruvyl transferase